MAVILGKNQDNGKFKNLVEDLWPDIVMQLDTDLKLIYSNQKAEKEFQLSQENMLGKRLEDLIDTFSELLTIEPGTPEIIELLNTSLHSAEEQELYISLLFNEGRKYFWTRIIPEKESLGSVQSIWMAWIDVTKEKKTEETLRQSERKYREIFSAIEEGYYEVDLKGNFVLFNESLCEMIGYSREELINLSYKDIYKNTDEVFKTYNRVYRTGEPEKAVNWPVVTKSGKEIFVEISITLQHDSEGKPIGFRGVARDITERKLAEEALQESEEKFRVLAESSPMAIMMYQDDYYVYVNPAAEEISGYSKEELYEMKFWKFVHPDYKEIVKGRGQKRQQGEKITPTYELKMITKQGKERWVSLTGATTHFRGRPAGFITVMDVTERKEAEEALRKSEEKYRRILATMEEGYYEVDLAGNITFCNESACNMAGYKYEELLGASFRELCKEPDKVFQSIKEVYKTRNPYYTLTLEIVRKDGSNVYIETSVTPIINENEEITGFRGVFRDITERYRFEEQLKYLSLHDQLTDLYNRAYFDNELNRLEGSREYPITIISLDLDGLKMVNDTMGHAQGDELLVRFARILQDLFRNSDIIARVGGDEFAVILPHTDNITGQKIMERVESALEKYNQGWEQEEKLPISASIGMATTQGQGKTLEDTFKEADDLMYQDKMRKGIYNRSQMVQALISILVKKNFVNREDVQRLENLCIRVGKKENLSEKQLSNLELMARMHYIGTIGVPDSILLKEEKLTPEEWEVLRQHVEKGYRIALSSVDLAEVADLILKHHERWNGTGYPLGLKGEEIPVECRILAIADAYESMTHDRPYRKAVNIEEAKNELRRCAGNQFDPNLVETFLTVIGED